MANEGVNSVSECQSLYDQHVMKTYARAPLVLERGRGCRVWDEAGNEYLDLVAGIAVCSLGHASPVLMDAVNRQLGQLHHVSNLYYTRPQAELARRLTTNSFADAAFFCNSGAEANEGAFKLARKYGHTVLGVETPVIITAHDSFHGRTLACITATGQTKYQKHFGPLMPGFDYVPFNNLDALRSKFAEHTGSRRVAAVMLEPVQGEGGVTVASAGYLNGVRQLCDEQQALLIFDEIQCGTGRTGKFWCHEHFNVEPDILTSAKGLAGGLPIGALLATKKANYFEPGEHASTFGGNALCCAAGVAVVDTINQPEFLAKVCVRGEELFRGLTRLIEQFPKLFATVRGLGLMRGLVVADGGPPAADFVTAARSEGLLIATAGSNVVRIVPPLIISPADIVEALTRLTRACQKVAA